VGIFKRLSFVFCCIWLPSFAAAAGAAGNKIDHGAGAALLGIVRDADTGDPLGWSELQIVELQRGVSANPDGSWHFFNLPPGEVTLRVTRIGYLTLTQHLSIARNDTLELTISLSHSPLTAPEVVITEKRTQANTGERVDLELDGSALLRQRAETIAVSILGTPGVAVRAMGPAPARPVLRGLGADRLLLLQNGTRLGDLSETSSDHAVAIDPASANAIVIIRGPGALAYGSSVLGGVIDVRDKLDGIHDLHRLKGHVMLQSATVDRSFTSGIALAVPVHPLVFSIDGAFSNHQDTHTPAGKLENTDLERTTLNGAVSLAREWGALSATAGVHKNDYGVPGGFLGAHPSGVNIDLERRHRNLHAEKYFTHSLFKRLDLGYDYSWFHQSEYESNGELGVEFGIITEHLDSRLRLSDHGPFSAATIGVWSEFRNYANGGFSFTPNSIERAYSAYIIEELPAHGFKFEGSLRADSRTVEPDQEIPDSRIGNIRERSFTGLSGALSASRPVSNKVSLGVSLMRAFRAPRIEELFSEGPHLAAYSYEFGNPDLEAEHALGVEFRTDYSAANLTAEVAVYSNRFSNYIVPRATGQQSPVRNDLEEYRTFGADARMSGAEGQVEYYLARNWRGKLTGSFVYGEFLDERVALPQVPPAGSTLSFTHLHGPFEMGLTSVAAAEQNRVDEFETPTAAWIRFDANFGCHWVWQRSLWNVAIVVQNIFDTEYQDHLNRVRTISPEPGTNVRVSLQCDL
jgi:iron complex outermembrane receptor protein